MNDVFRMKRTLLILFVGLMVVNAAMAAITKDQVEDALVIAERDVSEMAAAGLSITYVNQTLATAKMLFEGPLINESLKRFEAVCRAYSKESVKRYCLSQLAALSIYAARENGTSQEIIEENYPKIIELTDKIAESKRQAFEARDRIRAVELKIEDYGKFDVNTTNAEVILKDAKEAMFEERYDDALELVTRADLELESKRTELTIARVFLQASKGFFSKNKGVLLTMLLVVLVIAAVVQYPTRMYLLKRKIAKLKNEEKAVYILIKDVQRKRFASGGIPESTYNIKMEVYRKKRDEVREQLPLAERKLQRLLKFEGFKNLKQKLMTRLQRVKWLNRMKKPVEEFVFTDVKNAPYKPKKNAQGIEKAMERIKEFVLTEEKKR